ncbi:MAG: dipeptidase [Gemmatimonadota bacterium]
MGVAPLSREEALRLHRDVFVFDGHNDLAPRLFEGESLEDRGGRGHLDLARMRRGGLDGGIFAVWIDPDRPEPLRRALEGLERLTRILEDHPGVRVVRDADDLRAARREGRIAVVPGVEGGYGIVDRLQAVARLHEAGMRCLTLAWMRPTAWIDAAGADPVHGGLTAFGRRVVERLASLGVVIDVSHASDAATAEVIDVARVLGVPVAASHSGVRAVADHPRNLPDGLLEAVAATEGIVGINFFSAYLDAAYGRGFRALQERAGPEGAWDMEALARACARELAPVPFSRILEHAEHALRVAGAEHVGLGSDFDGVAALPEGMRDAGDLPRLTAGLAALGFDAPALEAFLGAAWLRVLSAVLS